MRHALLIASKAGRGHILRPGALAVALTESGWACQTIAHPGDELPAMATDLVVIDVPTPYAHDIGRRPKLVRVVDTQEATDDNYDLTVFGSAGAEASRTDSMLAGPLYALLRPEFCAERHIARTRSGVQDFRAIGGTALEKFKDKTVIVCCESGVTAGAAARKLAELGFTQVYNLRVGLGAWRQDNLPVVKG